MASYSTMAVAASRNQRESGKRRETLAAWMASKQAFIWISRSVASKAHTDHSILRKYLTWIKDHYPSKRRTIKIHVAVVTNQGDSAAAFLIYLNPLPRRSSVTPSNMIIPWEIYEGPMGGKNSLSGTFAYALVWCETSPSACWSWHTHTYEYHKTHPILARRYSGIQSVCMSGLENWWDAFIYSHTSD